MLRPWYFSLEIDKDNKEVPLYKQIAQKIQSLIIANVLKSGEVLPGSRVLATKLGVSRKSVVNAMELLIMSGWLINKERSGLYVALPTNNDVNLAPASMPTKEHTPHFQDLVIDDGVPDTRIAPLNELARAYRRLLHMKGRHNVLGYNEPYGIYKFREAISSMLNHERGMRTLADEIFITRGSQMGLYIVANALLKPGDRVVMERPCYEKAQLTFMRAGLNIIYVDVDQGGIIVDDLLPHLSQGVKAIYLTPRHQYPTMAELSNERRRQLAELARTHNFLVIEDDYDCDFSFRSSTTMPLSAMLPSQRYVYIGTFSKIIAPALRVGFITSSTDHIDAFGQLRKIIDIQGDVVMETAILELIESGDIRRHISKSTKYYKQKRQFFIELLEQHLSHYISFQVPQGGLALWVTSKQPVSPDALSEALQRQHISIPVFCSQSDKVGMRIGYASLSETDMNRLVKALEQAFTCCQQ